MRRHTVKSEVCHISSTELRTGLHMYMHNKPVILTISGIQSWLNSTAFSNQDGKFWIGSFQANIMRLNKVSEINQL
jgi:hypothetical protein